MISLEEFHQDFLQSILTDADSRGLMKPQSFFENVCEELTYTGDLTKNYTNADYTKKGMEIHGFDYDEERRILSLLVNQFFQTDSIETLTKQHIDTKFKRLETFYKKCVVGFYTEMEETSEAHSMAYQIYQWSENQGIDKIKLIILTDGKATRNLIELPDSAINTIPVEFRVIDISYLHKIYTTENESGIFEVETNLPYLTVRTTSNEYQSYLSVISGNELVKIYDTFGQKLFEQNVRTFLQFRGNVNKGLRNTIEYTPAMFFAYNNGITATATKVEIKNNKIVKIQNLQIVNGGQTTSAIFAAFKNFKQDVSDVSVQMKLSVVTESDKQSDFVSKVSEYANTQNKINKSDFFSNSPFHKEFKEYSKKISVSATDGSQIRTKWFYERVRGEYLNEQAYLTLSKKKQFQLEHPKKQVIDKTFLSKSENCWLQKPHIVSKGAQYSFIEYARAVTKDFENKNYAITENYFKESICKAILFKFVEKMISNAVWYDGGFRAQAVAYSIAYLSYLISLTDKYLNFTLIWKNQFVPDKLKENLESITEQVYKSITTPPQGRANVTQWCKQEDCWNTVKNLDCNVELDDLLIDIEERKYIQKESKQEKKLTSGIQIQSFIVSLDVEKKYKLQQYYDKYNDISEMEKDILNKYSDNRLICPSEKQSKILYKLYEKAISEGFVF